MALKSNALCLDIVRQQSVHGELITRFERQVAHFGKLLIVLFIKSRFIVLVPVPVQLLLASIVRDEPRLLAELVFFGLIILK